MSKAVRPKPKTYLGDGVYAVVRADGVLTVTTENGIHATNTVHFEPEVWAALQAYMTPLDADSEALRRRPDQEPR